MWSLTELVFNTKISKNYNRKMKYNFDKDLRMIDESND